MLRWFDQWRRKMSGLVLGLALLFACAPVIATALMAAVNSNTVSLTAGDAVPCPQHMTSHQNAAVEEQPGNVQADSGTQCFCGLFCHAVLAMATEALPLMSPLAAIIGPLQGQSGDGSWPQPLPRPPRS